LPKSAGWPSLALLPLFAALLASISNENHFVARNAGPPLAVRRPLLAEDFRAWQAARGAHGGEPVYLVAAAGGASRAAFWAGTLLLELERQARSQGKRFAPTSYAMSGVSGGSLGLAAFAGSLAVRDPDYERTAAEVGAFLGQDYLAPLLGYLLYPDLLARFWPFPCPACDRSLALEGAWERGWEQRFPLSPGRGRGSHGQRRPTVSGRCAGPTAASASWARVGQIHCDCVAGSFSMTSTTSCSGLTRPLLRIAGIIAFRVAAPEFSK
jgi:hypothetical protein